MRRIFENESHGEAETGSRKKKSTVGAANRRPRQGRASDRGRCVAALRSMSLSTSKQIRYFRYFRYSQKRQQQRATLVLGLNRSKVSKLHERDHTRGTGPQQVHFNPDKTQKIRGQHAGKPLFTGSSWDGIVYKSWDLRSVKRRIWSISVGISVSAGLCRSTTCFASCQMLESSVGMNETTRVRSRPRETC